ncbi:MAG: DNA internalization-related competence protein ComEC/Rec2 [Burkholderiaceae bacterium]
MKDLPPSLVAPAQTTGSPQPSLASGIVPVCVGILAGTAAQLQQAQLWSAVLYGALALGGAAVAGLGLWLRRVRGTPRGLGWAWLAIALAAWAFAATGWRALAYQSDALDVALVGRDLRVVAVVDAMPQRTELGVRLRLSVESAATLDGQPVRLPRRVEVGWSGGVWHAGPGLAADLQRLPPDVRAGERWAFTLRLRPPQGARNPHGFDYELWMWEQGVQAVGAVRAGLRDAPPERLASTAQAPVQALRQRVRDAIVQRLAAGDDPAQDRRAGVVAALVTGDQRMIDRADWDVFRATGVAHLMSISGLHITLFAWLAAAGVGGLWRRSARCCHAVPAPRAALLAGVMLAAAYALFSGWGVPAQRTVLMLATVAALRLAGLVWPWPVVWAAVAGVVVLIDPWALWQPGFWLSFVAVGILFATNPIANNSDGKSTSTRLKALLREQWTVTLALTPLGLLWFGQVSLVGLMANLVAIPWVTGVVLPLSLLGLLWPPVWDAAAWALWPLMAGLQALADGPWAVLALPAAPLWAGVAALAGGCLLAWRGPWALRVWALPLLLPALWWQPARPAPGQFELLAADVGQGNAVLVRTARHSLLYDAGPRYGAAADAGERVLVPLLQATGERLDRLVISHRDTDHTGGAEAVLRQHPQADVLASLEPGHALAALRPLQPCTAGQRWQWDGVHFEVLHPQAARTELPRGQAEPRPNTRSCVLRVEAAANGRRPGSAALLTGDIEAAQEQALVQAGAPLAADWLLVPHHGSRTSSTDAFVQAVAPRTALVQAGVANRYGHPAPEVLARYRAQGVAVVQTPQCGAAHWSSARPDAVVCERERERRYWQHAGGRAGSASTVGGRPP